MPWINTIPEKYAFEFVDMGVKAEHRNEEKFLVFEEMTRQEDGTFLYVEREIRLDHSHLVLDVGNHLEPGIVDHHQFRSELSATELVFRRPEFVTGWVEPTAEKPVTIIVHKAPDFDCCAAAFLAIHLLEFGKLEPQPDVQKFITHVTRMDQGKIQRPGLGSPPPYFLFSMYPAKSFLERMQWSFQFFAEVMNRIHHTENVDLEGLFQKDEYSDLQFKIEEDLRHYQLYMDKVDQVRLLQVQVPQKSSRRPVTVDGLYMKNPDQGDKPTHLFKIWARTDTERSPRRQGFIFTWVVTDPLPPAVQPRHVISVDPTSDVCLKGLGDLLNQWEREVRQSRGCLTDRDRTHPRWKDVGLNDPWYDGRGHEDTIVDSPRKGTLLEPARVETAIFHFMMLDSMKKTTVESAEVAVHLSFQLGSIDPGRNTKHMRQVRGFADGFDSFRQELTNAGFVETDLSGAVFVETDLSGMVPDEDSQKTPFGWSRSFSQMFARRKDGRSTFLLMEKSFPAASTGWNWNLTRVKIMLHDTGVGLISCCLALRDPTVPKSLQELLQLNAQLLPAKPLNLKQLQANLHRQTGVAAEELDPLFDWMKRNGCQNVTREFPSWRIRFGNLHEARHPRFPTRLYAALSSHREQIQLVQTADETAVRRGLKLGDYGRMFVTKGGAFYCENWVDTSLVHIHPNEEDTTSGGHSEEHRAESFPDQFEETGVNVLRFHYLVRAILQHLELAFSELGHSGAPTDRGRSVRRLLGAFQGDTSSRRLQLLHRLRAESIQIDSELVASAFCHQTLPDTMEKQVLALLEIESQRVRLMENLEGQDEYLTSRQEMLFQKRVTLVTAVALPASLLADYLGTLLNARGGNFPHFGLWFLLVAAALGFLFLLVRGLVKE